MQWPESREQRGTTAEPCSQDPSSPHGPQALGEHRRVCLQGIVSLELSRELGAGNSALPGHLQEQGSLFFPAGDACHPCLVPCGQDTSPGELGSASIRFVLPRGCTVELRNKKAC